MQEYPGHGWVSVHDGAGLYELSVSKDVCTCVGV